MKYLLVVLSLATLPGCAEKGVREYDEVENAPIYAQSEVKYEEPAAIALNAPPPIQEKTIIQRKLIRTGSINFEVNDIDSIRKSVDAIVKEINGYISSDEESHNGGDRQVEQVIRIPADNLDQLTNRIVSLAKKVISKEFSSQDVTEEFIDTQARLLTKRDLEKRYRELLVRATKVTEMLEVERQLEAVRSDIESMEGRIQYLGNQVAYSTLTISYYQVIPTSTEFAFGSRFFASLERGWRNILYFVLDIFEQWPFIIVVSGMFLIAYRWIRRKLLKPQPVTNV